MCWVEMQQRFTIYSVLIWNGFPRWSWKPGNVSRSYFYAWKGMDSAYSKNVSSDIAQFCLFSSLKLCICWSLSCTFVGVLSHYCLDACKILCQTISPHLRAVLLIIQGSQSEVENVCTARQILLIWANSYCELFTQFNSCIKFTLPDHCKINNLSGEFVLGLVFNESE